MKKAIPQVTLDRLLLTNCLSVGGTAKALLEAGANPNQIGDFATTVKVFRWHIVTMMGWDYISRADGEGSIFEILKFVDVARLNEMTEKVTLDDHPYGLLLLTGHRAMDRDSNWSSNWSSRAETLFNAFFEAGVKPPKGDGLESLMAKMYYSYVKSDDALNYWAPGVLEQKFRFIRKLYSSDELKEMMVKEYPVKDNLDASPRTLLEQCIDDWADAAMFQQSMLENCEAFFKLFIREFIRLGADINQKCSIDCPLIESDMYNYQRELLVEESIANIADRKSVV